MTRRVHFDLSSKAPRATWARRARGHDLVTAHAPRASTRPATSAVARVGASLLALALTAHCGGTEPSGVDAGSVRDGGPIDRRSPNDVDGDEWPNETDNCPEVPNPDQLDRDRDGRGDVCDACPATALPMGGAACEPVAEVEPNDTAEVATAIVLGATGAVRVATGVLEPADGGRAARDTFQIMVAADTRLRARVVRSGARALIEPELVVEGGAYGTPRRAEGLFGAERELYFAAAGTYTLTVRDRRGADAELGGPTFGYELALEVLPTEPERLVPPVRERKLVVGPEGRVFTFDVAVTEARRLRALARTTLGSRAEGADPIVVLVPAGGAAIENGDLRMGSLDARVLESVGVGTHRVVVDHARLVGTSPAELTLTVDLPAENEELEPNDEPEFASRWVVPGQTKARIDRMGAGGGVDVDVFRWDAPAGTVLSVRALVDANSQVDPTLTLFRMGQSGPELLYENLDSSGPSARLDAILPAAGPYYVQVRDQLGMGMNGQNRGGELFPYTLFTERLSIDPEAELLGPGPLEGVITPGGKLSRFILTASLAPTLVELSRTSVGNPELSPGIRVYAPGATALLADGADAAAVVLDQPATYVVAVHNTNAGRGGLDFRYSIDTRWTALGENLEAEPNDATPNALGALPAAYLGELMDADDVDDVLIDAPANARLDVVRGRVSPTIRVTLFRGGTQLGTSDGGDLRAVPTGAGGTLRLRVSAVTGATGGGRYAFAIRVER
jgi:hypothetical protein